MHVGSLPVIPCVVVRPVGARDSTVNILIATVIMRFGFLLVAIIRFVIEMSSTSGRILYIRKGKIFHVAGVGVPRSIRIPNVIRAAGVDECGKQGGIAPAVIVAPTI